MDAGAVRQAGVHVRAGFVDPASERGHDPVDDAHDVVIAFECDRDPFDPALAEVRLQVPPELLVTHRDKPIASGNFRLQDLVEGDGQSIQLLVAPARELEISSDGKLEDPHKSLTLILTVGTLANAKAAAGTANLTTRDIVAISDQNANGPWGGGISGVPMNTGRGEVLGEQELAVQVTVTFKYEPPGR